MVCHIGGIAEAVPVEGALVFVPGAGVGQAGEAGAAFFRDDPAGRAEHGREEGPEGLVVPVILEREGDLCAADDGLGRVSVLADFRLGGIQEGLGVDDGLQSAAALDIDLVAGEARLRPGLVTGQIVGVLRELLLVFDIGRLVEEIGLAVDEHEGRVLADAVVLGVEVEPDAVAVEEIGAVAAVIGQAAELEEVDAAAVAGRGFHLEVEARETLGEVGERVGIFLGDGQVALGELSGEVEGEGVAAAVDDTAVGDGRALVGDVGVGPGLGEVDGLGELIDADVLDHVAVGVGRDGDGVQGCGEVHVLQDRVLAVVEVLEGGQERQDAAAGRQAELVVADGAEGDAFGGKAGQAVRHLHPDPGQGDLGRMDVEHLVGGDQVFSEVFIHGDAGNAGEKGSREG